ncbi:MAG TPA: hypothetical protein VGL12_17785, partial [Roseiarcus sp.]
MSRLCDLPDRQSRGNRNLPARDGDLPEQDASKPGRTTADDPVQKFYWKDVYAKRGGTYRYRIVPMTGAP